MCGIAALFSNRQEDEALIKGMTEVVRHRGPDNQSIKGIFHDQTWLGHCRLSVIDTSVNGNQPMEYMNGRYCLTYNGEIYNYLELRLELEKMGYFFQTKTDSEVILAAYDKWGGDFLNHFNGMFSFVIVDLENHTYFAARDRFGVKPLYYWIPSDKRYLAIGSEIKEFTVLPGWIPNVNGQRAYDYLKYGLTDHTKETMFQNVFQLRGGEYIQGTLDAPTENIRITRWYHPKIQPLSISSADAEQHFLELFEDACRLRLRSDVELWSCLSGGLDSSSIVCVVNNILKKSKSAHIQKTISALSSNARCDESAYVQSVLRARQIDGYFVEPSPENLLNIHRKLIWHQDEPFGSTSIFAQWCVFQKAKEMGLTVMLDGQGADELLAGYHTFFAPMFASLFTKFQWKKLANEMVMCKKLHNYSYSIALRGIFNTFMPDKLLEFSKKIYGKQVYGNKWFSPERLKAEEIAPKYYRVQNRAKTVLELSRQKLYDTNLPMLLRYEDRNSMAHSIESRLPFLDYRLVEWLQSLPDEQKLYNGQTKVVMRGAMKGILPENVRMRMDKIGFETPEEVWEKEHQEEFRRLIQFSIESANGIITKNAVDFFENISSHQKLDFSIWRIINFGVWYDLFINKNPST